MQKAALTAAKTAANAPSVQTPANGGASIVPPAGNGSGSSHS